MSDGSPSHDEAEASLPPPKKACIRGAQHELKIEDVDFVQYIGVNFKVSIMVLSDGSLISSHEGLTKPELYFSDKRELCPSDIYELDWPPALENGQFLTRAAIKILSRDCKGRSFCIGLRPAPEEPLCFSNRFNVVTYKLVIKSMVPKGAPPEEYAEEAKNSEPGAPLVWYNQMGGGSSCVEVVVELQDAAGNPVCGGERRVPLKVSLHYSDDGELVRQQNILTLSDHSSRISEDGRAMIKVRIEEVSRRHQNRFFIVKISPDTDKDPVSGDISSVDSRPINVLSKITSRNRRDAATKAQETFTGLDAMSATKSIRQPYNLAPPQQTASMPIQVSLPPVEYSAPVPPVQVQSEQPLGEASSDQPEKQALATVMTWVQETLNTMVGTRWQLAGYEPLEDGRAPDHSKPTYTMRNPNAMINAQLTKYNTTIKPAFQTLVGAVNTIGAGGSAQSFGGPPKLERANTSAGLDTLASMVDQSETTVSALGSEPLDAVHAGYSRV